MARAETGRPTEQDGYGTEELERAGAYRVYEDPAILLAHLDELGGREG